MKPRGGSPLARIGNALREDRGLFVTSLSFAIAALALYAIVRAYKIAH